MSWGSAIIKIFKFIMNVIDSHVVGLAMLGIVQFVYVVRFAPMFET